MRILLTNDDGIRAPGIQAMHRALVTPSHLPNPRDAATRAPRDLVFPIAPLTAQSATSHGVTFHDPLMTRVERLSWPHDQGQVGISVDGRPADCVKLALSALWPDRFEGGLPDLCISGMNAGANCGINVIYSGTVAAAIEAAFLGVPSIAVSLHIGGGEPNFDVAAGFARLAIERLLMRGLPRPHECLSINIPITERDGQMPPIRVCPMNTHGLIDQYERRVSPEGRVYYWAAGHGLDFRGTDSGSDVHHLLDRCITVTPLTFDLTAHAHLERWREVLS